MTSPDDDYASTSTDDSVVPEVIYTAMVTKNEGPEERAPVQAVAEVAPTSPATAAFLDTPIDSKPLPHTTPQSEQAEPSLNSHMSIATVDRDPGSLSGSPTMDVGSPEGAPPRVDLQAQTTSVLQGDIEMASQPQYDVRMDSQPQDKKLVGHMSPVKLRSILDPNTKMRTPPPATPPPSKDAAAIDAGPNGATPESATALLTPASTAPPSDRASSPIAPFFANFDSQRKGAIHQHYRRARIFPKTRELMYSFSGKMLVVASRGFGRGRLPTRQTKPPLLKRRHSIDVNTTNSWGTWWAANFKAPEIEQGFQEQASHRLETVRSSTNFQRLPHPARYAAFAPVWLLRPAFNSSIYLELGDVTIRNDAYLYITETEYSRCGIEAWMRDESIDMALEVLRRDADCDAHGIAIANSTMAQICYFAAFSEDSTSQEYDEYKVRFCDKYWIFLVVNDAIGGNENDGRSGTHWSLVAMDVRKKYAFYYDSLFKDSAYHQGMGCDISRGMLKILGEDERNWRYHIEKDCPNQNWQNQYDYDDGACGPFVFTMINILVERIKRFRRDGREHECWINIDRRFGSYFMTKFHSLRVREDIKMRIARWKAHTDGQQIADQYDQDAIRDVNDIVLDDGPVISFEVPRRPVIPLRKVPRRPVRYTNHQGGSSRKDAIEVEDSDSDLSSNASSSGHTEVHDIKLDDEPENDPFDDPDVDIVMNDENTVEDNYDYHHGGVSIIVNEDASEGHRTVPNSPEHSDKEAEVQAVTRLA